MEDKKALAALRSMLLIRNFEMRGEAAYQQGLVGGFYHAYTGQEAIQTAVVDVFGKQNWFAATYRCHALALLLGESPGSLMAELYGKETGNCGGRGGSMHFFSDRMLGGLAIVGGHVPLAVGAAFSLKYQGIENEFSLCFLGEGAVAQGAFHESLNLASLWELPAIFIIENNQWGMGTAVSRAVCAQPIAERQAHSYGISGYTLDGMDYFACVEGFKKIRKEAIETKKPILVECLCERFTGHSISDPAFYRSKDELKKVKERDPILLLKEALNCSDEELKALDKEAKNKVVAAMKFAQESSEPSIGTLEEGVYADD
ncbi:MAG: Acetoin:2,6-dichlorophenolindophenol oxidoreductase subunit alpha [Chlamydiales bacterium]|nr:Acetoin:2,6-dichlorophenolindophenol oxidoreductase subunit alpha [Chlamydiales bacterium]MCH9620136.1 Acetoin:2,6-dichlorophenolindophenol oxidoreductase subunit alpha [Chlamydiales bacterium]MCH9623606.1 Acetoin:2,6-dichlorophenolindophenol oxidoreductase subunit alpha [Chlamydiales bacterium]